MRLPQMRTIVLGLVVGALVTLFLLAEHLRQLGDVARTYATFHGLIRGHPELLYKYPEAAENKEEVVPHIIHQIALGQTNVAKYSEAIATCHKLHPDWEFNVWTDANATAFLKEHYPDVEPHYTGYHQNIQRANVLRYALLHHFGGVYLDVDVSCHVALDTTPIVKLDFVSPGAHPAGVNNAFIATKPKHPFLGHVLKSLASHDLYWGLPMRIPYVENMLSTGCMYYTNMWMAYVRSLLAGGATDRVYILATEDGDMAPHMLRGKVTTPLFTHGGASSWHSWDAGLLLLIGNHYMALLSGLALVAGVIGVFFYMRSARSRRARGGLESGLLALDKHEA